MAESLLEIGIIVGTHGLRGDLKVRLNSGDPEVLLSLKNISLTLPDGKTQQVVIGRQVKHKGQVLLRLQGYDSINQVEPMIGSKVLVAEDALPELHDDEFYWKQLDGLQVIDRDLGDIGILKDLFTSAAHDVYVVRGSFGEILIPAVQEFVLAIDLEAGTMQVALPEGLVPDAS